MQKVDSKSTGFFKNQRTKTGGTRTLSGQGGGECRRGVPVVYAAGGGVQKATDE